MHYNHHPRSKGLKTFSCPRRASSCRCSPCFLDWKFSRKCSYCSPSRQNSTSSSLSLLPSLSLKSANRSHPELGFGTSLQNYSSLTSSATWLRRPRLSVLLSMILHGDDSFSITLFFRGSLALVAREMVTCWRTGSGSVEVLGLREGLMSLVDWRRLLQGCTWLELETLLLGLTEEPLFVSNILCLRCILLLSLGCGEALCCEENCWLMLEQLFSPLLLTTELVSVASFFPTFYWVTSIIFLDFTSSFSLSWISKWWIQSMYSFSLILKSFILFMNFCSASATLPPIRLSASLYSLPTRSISFRQPSSIFLTEAAQPSRSLPMPSSSYFLLILSSNFFSKPSPILSTILLISLTTTWIFFSMAASTSLVWLPSMQVAEFLCPKLLSFFIIPKLSVCASRLFIFSDRY